MADGSVEILVTLDKKELEKGLNSVKGSLKELNNTNFSDKIVGGLDKIADTSKKLGTTITKSVTAPLVTMFTAATLKAKSFIGTYEGAIAIFQKKLGETGASEMYDQLLKIAKGSTFAQEYMIKAGQTLVAMGISAEDTAKYVQVCTDAISGMGGSGAEVQTLSEVFGKMANQTTLYTQDLNQLATNGIPVFDILAEKYGISKDELREMTRKGMLPAKQTLDDLTDVLMGNVKGMEKWSIQGLAMARKGRNINRCLR